MLPSLFILYFFFNYWGISPKPPYYSRLILRRSSVISHWTLLFSFSLPFDAPSHLHQSALILRATWCKSAVSSHSLLFAPARGSSVLILRTSAHSRTELMSLPGANRTRIFVAHSSPLSCRCSLPQVARPCQPCHLRAMPQQSSVFVPHTSDLQCHVPTIRSESQCHPPNRSVISGNKLPTMTQLIGVCHSSSSLRSCHFSIARISYLFYSFRLVEMTRAEKPHSSAISALCHLDKPSRRPNKLGQFVLNTAGCLPPRFISGGKSSFLT